MEKYITSNPKNINYFSAVRIMLEGSCILNLFHQLLRGFCHSLIFGKMLHIVLNIRVNYPEIFRFLAQNGLIYRKSMNIVGKRTLCGNFLNIYDKLGK
jgi:hypothetical protein